MKQPTRRFRSDKPVRERWDKGLIANRWVRLALIGMLAAGAAAALGIVLRRRRRAALGRASEPDPGAEGAREAGAGAMGPGITQETGAGVAAESSRGSRLGTSRETVPWPPEPILGRPTAEVLARYAAQPPPRVPELPDLPSLPQEPKARRKVLRWAAVVVVVCLLFGAGQLLEDAVFGKQPELGPTVPGMRYEGEFAPADPGIRDETVNACEEHNEERTFVACYVRQ